MRTRGVSDEQRVFEAMWPDLVRTDLGRFAVICGDRLFGIYPSVDEALSAVSRAFDAHELPDGAPLLISEIAQKAAVRITAQAHPPDPLPNGG